MEFVDPNDVARREAKIREIALAFLEQCKRLGEIRVSDLDDILAYVKRSIVL